jgi:hypothetical protein
MWPYTLLAIVDALFRVGSVEVVQGDEPLLCRGVVEKTEQGLENRPANSERDQPKQEKDHCGGSRFFHSQLFLLSPPGLHNLLKNCLQAIPSFQDLRLDGEAMEL